MIRQKRQDPPVFHFPSTSFSLVLSSLSLRLSMCLMASRMMSSWVTLSLMDTVGIHFFSLKWQHKLIGLQCEKFAEIGCQDIFSVFTSATDFVYTLSNGPHLLMVKKELHGPIENGSFCGV